MQNSLIAKILAMSNEVKGPPRNTASVFFHASSEIGELAEEILIAKGLSYKKPGADGVIGEAIDAIISLVDLIYVHAKSEGICISEQGLIDIAEKKLQKWKEKSNEIQSG